MDTPAADIDVDETLVRSLLTEQHADLADLPLRLVANGWDNAIYRLGLEYAVRVPRRTIAAQLVEHENTWLPVIAPLVHVAIPVPVRTGAPSDRFPWQWSVTRWVDGELAADTPFDEHGTLAVELARFVRDLHVEAPANAPANPVRGVPLQTRADAVAGRFASGLVPHAAALAAVWQSALDTPPWAGPPLWLHGDLHPANIIARGGRLAAVIDFGDMTSGDPATDLATAWLTFDPDGRRAFTRELAYDGATWSRARGWAVTMATAVLANSADAPAMRRVGLHAVEQLLEDQP
ncbi:aminoglycoside phosphotransferase family protein [Diaminobutyricibacter sp. McL0618]|uniref:aminoglycoside phosphotransferase family protein n=1 Tax=Leifsonia sp. McL0618 TaxID=3415677 RepID=UPI003CE717D6